MIVWDNRTCTQPIFLVHFGFEAFVFAEKELCKGLLIVLILIQVCIYCLEKLVSKFWKGSFKLILLWNVCRAYNYVLAEHLYFLILKVSFSVSSIEALV